MSGNPPSPTVPPLSGFGGLGKEKSGRDLERTSFPGAIGADRCPVMRKGFVIHHNGPPARCVGQPHLRCERFWAAIRNYHVNTKGWSDIAYSFGMCPHGTLFTGRGWHKNQFANGSDVVGANDGKDSEWYTVIVFLGTDEKPTPEMVAGVRDLIAKGREFDRCDNRVLPHNAFKFKACPGPEFTTLARQWDGEALTTSTQGDDDLTPEQAKTLDAVNVRTIALDERLDRFEGRLDAIFERLVPAETQREAIRNVRRIGLEVGAKGVEGDVPEYPSE